MVLLSPQTVCRNRRFRFEKHALRNVRCWFEGNNQVPEKKQSISFFEKGQHCYLHVAGTFCKIQIKIKRTKCLLLPVEAANARQARTSPQTEDTPFFSFVFTFDSGPSAAVSTGMQLIADALDELPDCAPDSIDCNSGNITLMHIHTYGVRTLLASADFRM